MIRPVSPEGTPTLKIVKPEDGATVYTTKAEGITIGVGIMTTSFIYTVNWKGENIKNCGTAYSYLDVEPPTVVGKSALTAKGTYAKVRSEGDFLWGKVKPGKHTLYAQLVNYDLTPLDPPVVAKISFEIVYEAPPSPTP